jgi:hypothetical protein
VIKPKTAAVTATLFFVLTLFSLGEAGAIHAWLQGQLTP